MCAFLSGGGLKFGGVIAGDDDGRVAGGVEVALRDPAGAVFGSNEKERGPFVVPPPPPNRLTGYHLDGRPLRDYVSRCGAKDGHVAILDAPGHVAVTAAGALLPADRAGQLRMLYASPANALSLPHPHSTIVE